MNGMNELTSQERRVLELVAMGRRNASIADELCISIRTVENHLYRAFDKLNVSSRTEAAIHVLHASLLSLPEMSSTTHDETNTAG
jgi:DNA-binding NarL/FixJ family response regulator